MRKRGNQIFELAQAAGVDPITGTDVNTGTWIGLITIKDSKINTLKETDEIESFSGLEIDSGVTFYARDLITSVKLDSGSVLMIRIV